MKRNKNVFVTLLVVTLLGCSTQPELEDEYAVDKTFPDVKKLIEYPQTTFLATLESPLNTEKNGIYAASLLFAWDEIKNKISDSITEIESHELARMNNSNSYGKVLSDNEYRSSVEIEGDMIRARAYFKKSLPFINPLIKHEEPLMFLNDKVTSFGFWAGSEISKIMYYNSDDDFAIKLFPRDEEHEIVLMKSTFAKDINLKSEINRLANLASGFKNAATDKNFWKYYYNDDDQVAIPIIELNIETNYSDIEGSNFSAGDRDFLVNMVYQRTAFVLNERGAEVESEVEMAVEEVIEEEDLPKPKNMIFNKPYLILLKRKDNQHPYFAMFVANSELMKKQE